MQQIFTISATLACFAICNKSIKRRKKLKHKKVFTILAKKN
jgi:hypothetical protein